MLDLNLMEIERNGLNVICLHFVEYNIVVYTVSKRAYVSIRFFETPLYLI